MAKLIFSLRGVPEDEAMEVRQLLTEQNIDFYETSAGNWAISMPGLWLKNTDDLERAQNLLNAYQQQRYITQRALYLQLKQAGQHKTLLKAVLERPLLYAVYILVMLMVVYASVKLVFEFGLTLPSGILG